MEATPLDEEDPGVGPHRDAGKDQDFSLYGLPNDGYDYSKHLRTIGAPGAVFLEPFRAKHKSSQPQSAPSIPQVAPQPPLDDRDDELGEDLLAIGALQDVQSRERRTVIGQVDRDIEAALLSDDDEGQDELDDGFVAIAGVPTQEPPKPRKPVIDLQPSVDMGLMSDMFEQLATTYGEEDIGELDDDDERAQGLLSLDQFGGMLDSLLDDPEVEEEEEEEEDEAVHLRVAAAAHDVTAPTHTQLPSLNDPLAHARTLQLAQAMEEEDEPAAFVVERRKEAEWDADTIISTYSNLDNHPNLIREPIRVSHKTGIPLLKPMEEDYGGPVGDSDESVGEAPVNKGAARPKNESRGDKRMRKQEVKRESKVARKRKKELRVAYVKEEGKQKGLKAKGGGDVRRAGLAVVPLI